MKLSSFAVATAKANNMFDFKTKQSDRALATRPILS